MGKNRSGRGVQVGSRDSSSLIETDGGWPLKKEKTRTPPRVGLQAGV